MSTETDALNAQLVDGLRNVARTVAFQMEQARRTCISCENFDASTEHCKAAKPPARPPARVIALGCPSWYSLPF